MKNNLTSKIFPDEEAFQKIYFDCLDREQAVSETVTISYKAMRNAFDGYLGAMQEDTFRFAYQCGYEAAMAEVEKGGVAE